MNYIRAVVTKLENVDSLNIVSFMANNQTIKMMSLELNEKVKVGVEVVLAIKSTNISLAKELNTKLSIANILHVEITKIKYGELLCSISINFEDNQLESIITKESCLNMSLEENEKIVALISENEISIMEVL